eukprot:364419-Chlamydomonas_euryale.AAC.3
MLTPASTTAAAQYSFGPHTIRGSEVFALTDLSFAFVNLKPVVPGDASRKRARIQGQPGTARNSRTQSVTAGTAYIGWRRMVAFADAGYIWEQPSTVIGPGRQQQPRTAVDSHGRERSTGPQCFVDSKLFAWGGVVSSISELTPNIKITSAGEVPATPHPATH